MGVMNVKRGTSTFTKNGDSGIKSDGNGVTFAYDDMASGACAHLIASMININIIF